MDVLSSQNLGGAGIGWADSPARMIRPTSDEGRGGIAPFVRKAFDLPALTGTEVLRVSAMGLYRAFINGRRVGDDLLTPGWTVYDERIAFQTYPVAELLREGANTIEIWLGDGWYRSQLMAAEAPLFDVWGDRLAAIAELRSSAAGAVVVATDETWVSGKSRVLANGIYLGETYDARAPLEVTGATVAIEFDLSKLVSQEAPPVKELAPIAPAWSWQDDQGRTIYDFGQNAAGYVRVNANGAAGARIIVEHAEVLEGNAHFYNGNLRSAAARVEYVLDGSGDEEYAPLFTFQGFRYARVTIVGEASLEAIRFLPISSVAEQTSSFTSGNPLVDKLFMNTVWSQRSNFVHIPTDCPQRDERLGWTGDAQVFAGTACYLADCRSFFRQWLKDLVLDQREDGAVPHISPDPTRHRPDSYPGWAGSTGWGDAIHEVPWQLYLHYGDKAVLADVLPAMVKWVDFLWSISNGPVVSPPRVLGQRGFTFGDWLQPKGPSAKPLSTIGDDAAATIYLHIAAAQVARIAGICSDATNQQRLTKMAEAVKSAFAEEFVTPSGRVAGDDQTSYALAIVHDLVPPEKLAAAVRHFRKAIERADGKIGTGFIGTPALLPALVKVGELGLAGEVFLQEDVPGWLYQVSMGATTIWERWDAIQADGTIYNPQMNSYNHYAYGAVCQWLLEGVAGFRPDPEAPGFEHILFEPVIVGGLSPVRSHHDSPRGRIDAGWVIDGTYVTYEIEIPEASRGTLLLRPEYSDAELNGAPIDIGLSHALPSGRHTITFTYTVPPARIAKGPTVNVQTP